jgi:hypothetical protein
MALVSWDFDVQRASALVSALSQQDKIAVGLHDFAAVAEPEVVEFDYADGPNGVRGQHGATAFPSIGPARPSPV